jgi:periplasmic protein TonB
MGAESHNTTLQQGSLLSDGRPVLGRWIAASIALHLSILGVLLYTRPPQLTPVEPPGDRAGHLLQLTYLPGDVAPSSTLQAPKRPAGKPVHTHTVTAPVAVPVPVPVAPPAVMASASTDTGTGADALGDGDTTIALVVVHPPPHPDLTRLPAGAGGDVIVDVVIDKTGRIAKFTMMRGLGHGIDETVLATIQQWTFQPATRNGVPVASEQELLFHYVRG